MGRDLSEVGIEICHVYVLKSDGRIVIQQKKNELFAELGSVEALSFFDPALKDHTMIGKLGDQTIAYAQRYCEEYGLYIVVTDVLADYGVQIRQLIINTMLYFIMAALAV